MKFTDHTFKQGDTVEGVIQLHNSHSMSTEAARIFMIFYNQANDVNLVPKVGQTVQIPVDPRIAKLRT